MTAAAADATVYDEMRAAWLPVELFIERVEWDFVEGALDAELGLPRRTEDDGIEPEFYDHGFDDEARRGLGIAGALRAAGRDPRLYTTHPDAERLPESGA